MLSFARVINFVCCILLRFFWINLYILHLCNVLGSKWFYHCAQPTLRLAQKECSVESLPEENEDSVQ
jgi:hypothetical protein